MFPDRFYTLPVPARCKDKSCIFDRGPPVRPPAARRPKNDSHPDFFLHCFGVHQIKSSDPSPTAKACFERNLASAARSSLYMGIAASLVGIALVIGKGLWVIIVDTKVKDQQVERLKHGPSLDEDVT